MFRLLRITLTDFRNYAHLVWSPAETINILTGPNGSGKTNILEAISLLAPGRGLRTARPDALARNGAEGWAVASRLALGDNLHELGTGTVGQASDEGSRPRIFRLDGASARAQSDIAAIVSVVWLTPQMERLFGEAASGRRRFLDRLVAGLDQGHARGLAAHEAAVATRNRLLLERREEAAWLRAAEDSIARHATTVTASRLSFCRRLNAASLHSGLAFPAAGLDLLCPIAERLLVEPARLVEDWVRECLAASRIADGRAGTTSVGAHRCDVAIFDAQTKLPANLASTGQQKSLLLGIVLAHAALIEVDRGDPPILLLDEPLVHLDDARRAALFDHVRSSGSQVMMTGTDAAPFIPLAPNASLWQVGGETVRPNEQWSL